MAAAEKKRTPKVVKYAKRGRLRNLLEAIERGESVNAADDEKRSALFCATLKGNKKCMKELLLRGANPNQRNKDGLTPCHAAALGGSPPSFPNGIAATRNPFKCVLLCSQGVYNLLAYHLHDKWLYRRSLEYLVANGGDLGLQSLGRETVRDIAVRMRKIGIVQLVEKHYDLEATCSGFNIRKGQSMLRPTNSYPHSCPHWMHTVVQSNTVENMSPLHSQASLYHGRVTNVFDYGFVHSSGSRASPGAVAAVPEIMPSEISHTHPKAGHSCADGSLWRSSHWGPLPVTTRWLRPSGIKLLTTDQLLREMDVLSLLRHPNVAMVMAVCCGPTRMDLCLVLEPLTFLSLHHTLHRHHHHLTPHERLSVVSGTASALAYLHTVRGVAHSLISSHSLYLNSAGVPKLVNVYCSQPPKTAIVVTPAVQLFLPWMAPEFIRKRVSAYCSDVYSLGVLVWEVWGGGVPWEGWMPPQLCVAVAERGERLPVRDQHSMVAEVLRSCFAEPSARPSACEILTILTTLRESDSKVM